jgi:prephenate dehydratase
VTTPLSIAFQGELGAFSEDAVRTWFGSDVEPIPCREFREVGEAIRSGRASAGLLPVENSLAGSVLPAYDVLMNPGLSVVGEVIRPIRHFLLGLPNSTLEELTRVISHPVALAQCGRFLSEHPHIEAMAVYDTAGAAREVSGGDDPRLGAVASERAAKRYGLRVLASDLQDRSDNQTRFLVVRKEGVGPLPGEGERAEHGWKTALVVETENRPGSLVDILLPFSEEGVNLSKLESRPGVTPWSYRFVLELEGIPHDNAVDRAMAKTRERARSVRVIGSFHPWAQPPTQ